MCRQKSNNIIVDTESVMQGKRGVLCTLYMHGHVARTYWLHFVGYKTFVDIVRCHWACGWMEFLEKNIISSHPYKSLQIPLHHKTLKAILLDSTCLLRHARMKYDTLKALIRRNQMFCSQVEYLFQYSIILYNQQIECKYLHFKYI